MRSKLIELAINMETDSQVLHFLSIIRTDLENYSKDKYPALKFYSNWTLHSQINDFKIFNPLFLEVLELFNEKKRQAVNAKINEITSFKKLSEELKLYLKEVKIHSNYLDGPQWTHFKKHLRSLVLLRPINLKSLNTKLTQFVITDQNYIQLPQKSLYWQLHMKTSEFPLSSPIEESLY